jgi:hypothetical protein
MIGLDAGSLLKRMAHFRARDWAWIWMGGIEASSSRLLVIVNRKRFVEVDKCLGDY